MTVLIAYQKALKNALAADSALMSMITGVFDYFPDDKALPYIVFGESSETPNDPIGAGTGTRMSDVTMTIEVLSDAPGRLESLTILNEMETALDVNLTLDRGIAVGRPEIRIMKATPEETTGIWKIPVEVHQLITNI
ncbi:MAG TPA: DUF3168 domain-containing protein [Methanocella sp.]|jgi:hypothetical protein